jgi:hypothetical protein
LLGGVLQESGILLGGCLNVKNFWGVLTGVDGVGFEIKNFLKVLIVPVF